MIPKNKLAILIGAIKPKKDKEEGESGYGEEGGDVLEECAEKILKAVKEDDVDSLSDALHMLVMHVQEEDKKQDAEEEESEEEEG